MHYAVVIPDGASDRPIASLGGKTPLEAADMPALTALAREGRMVSALTVPEGFSPGSDVACLSVMGFDPAKYYTGRAPLEAAAMGLSLKEGQAVFRANTVTVADGIMKDYSAGHISTEEAREVVRFLGERLDLAGVSLHAGVQYRHACILDNAAGRIGEATPPHDILDRPIAPYLPTGGVAGRLIEIMERTRGLLPDCEANRRRIRAGKKPVTQLWLWGGGVMPKLPTYADRYGIRGGLISAVDLLKGIAKLAGIEVVSVPGATGYYDTDYAGKGRAAIECLARLDLVIVHVEAPDEAGHSAHLAEKIRALENIDRHIIAPLGAWGRKTGDLRMLVMPDHPTPMEIRTHSGEPVPACLWGAGVAPDEATGFSERAVSSRRPIPAHTLMERLIHGTT
ncbi:MAG: cofactor-independent phosphoglycerate mutase [Planctomycetota bacterium]